MKAHALPLLALIGAVACGETALPPHGEALVIVDTDLPVPQLASRLRVDLYGEDGRWLESRDIGRSDRRDWPASFSVYSDDDTRLRRVRVRLRVYPEGQTRDYRGERFEPRALWSPKPLPASITELCANAPELPLGKTLMLRRGSTPLTELVAYDACKPPTTSGSVAARVVIPTKGRYRFSIGEAKPFDIQPTLFLRSRCEDPASQIACAANLELNPLASTGHFPRFDAVLEPGTYFLLSGGDRKHEPAEIGLEVLPIDFPLPDFVDPPVPVVPPSTPRLVRSIDGHDVDITPATEPVPTAAIDRLLEVHLPPNVRGSVRVTMHGACAGTMVNLATGETCIDKENERVVVSPSPLAADMTRPTTSVQGTFVPNEPCSTDDSDTATACVPGGAFLLGSQTLTPREALSSAPSRIALMSRFWMDRYEVTVGRLRGAIARGLAIDSSVLLTNDATFDPNADLSASFCSFTTKAGDREDYAANCLAWPLAHAFCQMEGGELPTEAQWEYAAASAGRPFPTLYPWGNETPACERADYGRAPKLIRAGLPTSQCAADEGGPHPAVPLPVTRFDGRNGLGDVTPLGIVGLGGGVGELLLDAGHSYASDCWRAAPLRDPKCIEEDPIFRAARGGTWVDYAGDILVRAFFPPRTGPKQLEPTFQVGFRCVYSTRRPR